MRIAQQKIGQWVASKGAIKRILRVVVNSPTSVELGTNQLRPELKGVITENKIQLVSILKTILIGALRGVRIS
jgi:hypothetical protein